MGSEVDMAPIMRRRKPWHETLKRHDDTAVEQFTRVVIVVVNHHYSLELVW